MKKSRLKIPVLILSMLVATAFMLPLFPITAAAEPDYSTVRVRLSIGANDTSYITSMNITLNGSYYIKENPGAALQAKAYTVKISGSSIGLFDGSTNIYTGPQFTLKTNRAAGGNLIKLYNLRYNANLSYLGDMQFKSYAKVVSGATRYYIMAINNVHIEEYLYGVVPHEMSNTWPIEALKAQAVAARGYVIREMSPSADYDVGDTSSNQVYKGFNPANNNAINAVNATQKQIITCNGKLVQTFFAASNGGEVDIAPYIWSDVTPLPYQVVHADPYDRRNPSSPQEQKVFSKIVTDTPDDAALLMIKANYIQPKLVAENKFSPSGTPIAVTTDFVLKEIMSMTGTVPADHLKYKDYNAACTHVDKVNMHVKVGTYYYDHATAALLPQDVEYDITIPVTDFEAWNVFNNTSLRVYFIEEIKDSAGTLTGYNLRHARYGHGIGLSQRGAQQMANEGLNYVQIIQFYFPNTVFEVSPYIHDPETTAPAAPPQSPAPSSKPAIQGIGKITSNTLNIRSGPSTGNSVLGCFTKNCIAEIVKYKYTADWHQIWYNNQFAYIHKDYLSLLSGSPATIQTDSAIFYASVPSEVLATLPKGTSIQVFANSGDYAYAYLNGLTGYVLNSALVAPSAPAAPAPSGKPAIVSIAKIKSSKTYIRSGPSTSKSKLATLVRGKTVEVVKRNYSKDWHQVWYNGKIGYIHKNYVSVAYGYKYAVKANTAALKKSASSSSATLLTMKKGDAYNKYGTSGSYIYINYNGTTGYIHKNAMTATAASTTPAGQTTSGKPAVVSVAKVKSSTLTIRTGPGTNYSKAGKTTKNKMLDVVKRYYNKDWHQIWYNGKLAYVHKNYVTVAYGYTYAIKASTTALKASPSSSAKTVLTMHKGDKFNKYGTSGSYVYINFNGITGYIKKSAM